jgi:hypothetical protein
MHAHACYNRQMRTTVEMKPQHRAALLALAARRGEKGFSSVLAEAIEVYLNDGDLQRKRKEILLRAGNAISEEDANHLRAVTKQLRENWR